MAAAVVVAKQPKEIQELISKGLKFGDVITLKLDAKNGYISANDRCIPQVRVDELQDDVDSPPEVRDCLFQVTQRCQYSAKSAVVRELAKNNLREDLLSERNFDGADDDDESSSQFAGVKNKKARAQLIALERAFRREQAVNDDEFKQVVGETVMYGQIIQLRHVSTDKFLTIKRTAADVERGALKIILEEHGAEGSCFQIFSGYRTKPEGAKVMHDDVVALKSVVFQGNGVHISSASITLPYMLPAQPHPYNQDGISYEISAAPEVVAMRIVPFTMHTKVLPLLKQRMLGNAYVSIQDLVANSSYVNVLGAANGANSLCFESLLSRASTATDEAGTDVWRIEPVTIEWSGLPIQHGSRLRIRHVMTGLYLAASSKKAKVAVAAGKAGSKDVVSAMEQDATNKALQRQQQAAAARRAASPARQASQGVALELPPVSPPAAPPPPAPAPATPQELPPAAEVAVEPVAGALPLPPEAVPVPCASTADTKVPLLHSVSDHGRGSAVPPESTASPLPSSLQPATSCKAPAPLTLAVSTPGIPQERGPPQVSHLKRAASSSGSQHAGKASDPLTMTHPDMRAYLTPLYMNADTVWNVVMFSKEEAAASHKVYTFFRHEASDFWLSGAGPEVPQPSEDDLGLHEARADQSYPVVHPLLLERNVMVMVKLDDAFTSKVDQMQRWQAAVSYFAAQLLAMEAPEQSCPPGYKLRPESWMLAAAEDSQKAVKLVEAIAKSPMKELYDVRYKALKRLLLEVSKVLDPSTWESSKEPDAFREYQTLARQSGLIAAVGAILQQSRVRVFLRVPDLRTSQLGRLVIELARNCHRHLRMVCKENEPNQAYISSRFSGIIMDHLTGPIKAADTLAALYEDNMTQMQTVTEEIIHASVDLVRTLGHQPRYLNFLRQICGTRDRPMPNNQNWLVREITGPGRDATDVFFEAAVVAAADGGGEAWIITTRAADGSGFQTLDCSTMNCEEDLTTKSILDWGVKKNQEEDRDMPQRRLFIYYCYSLQLLATMCTGRNGLARQAILEMSRKHRLGLEFETLHRAIRNDRLPYALRNVMLQLVISLHVDVEPYQPIRLPRLIRLMPTSAEAEGNEGGSDYLAVVPQDLTALMDTGLCHLQATVKHSMELELADTTRAGSADEEDAAAQDAEDRKARAAMTVGRNSYTLLVLKLMRGMFGLGMMRLSHPKTQELLETLLRLMRSLDAMPLHDAERFKVGPTSSVVMEAKKVVLQTLEFALDMQSEEQCACIYAVFATWQRTPAKIHTWAANQRSSTAAAGAQHDTRSSFRATRSMLSSKVAPETAEDLEQSPLKAMGAGLKSMVRNMVDSSSEVDQIAATAAEVVLGSRHEAFAVFRLDPAGDMRSIDNSKMQDCMSYLLDLTRYDEPVLMAKTWQIIERLLSKREKLVAALMRTFVVTDDQLIVISGWAQHLLAKANQTFNHMASLDPEQRERACTDAVKAWAALSSLMQPLQAVTLEGHGQQPQSVYITKVMASNCQFLLHDKQAHLLALKFLKLPLVRVAPHEPHQLWDVQDPARRDVFAACLQFLTNFMVVGDDSGSVQQPNTMNQAAITGELRLVTSYLQISGLPVSDCIAAMFCKSLANAQKHGPTAITKFVKLTVRFGKKRRAMWINLLRKLLVVDGTAIKRNQTLVMQLASQYEDQFLELFDSTDGSDTSRIQDLLDNEDVIKAAEEPHVRTLGSLLSYHIACVRLVAECCIGKEPELIVKASGYISLEQATNVLLLPTTGAGKHSTRRRLGRAYWDLLRHVYYSTDTENTRVQVRNPSNRMWLLEAATALDASVVATGSTQPPMNEAMARFLGQPLPNAQAALLSGGASALIEVVMLELEAALAEPQDALTQADSATYHVAMNIFPALQEYFQNHAASHFAKMAVTPTEAVQALRSSVMKLQKALRALKGSEFAHAIKEERNAASAACKALVAVVTALLEAGDGAPLSSKEAVEAAAAAALQASRCVPDTEPSHGAPSSMKSSVKAAEAQRVVQQGWAAFVRALGKAVSVSVDFKNNQAEEYLEVLGMEEGFDIEITTLKQYSLFKLARLLAGRYNHHVIDVEPRMCYEEGVAQLCGLLASRSKAVAAGWSDELLVKMIRGVRAALAIDDGHGSSKGWYNGWRSVGLVLEDGDSDGEEEARKQGGGSNARELREWKQVKYSALTATTAAVRLMAHPKIEVQFEAFELLSALLEGGNKVVQDTMFELLDSVEDEDNLVSQAVFTNINAGLERCIKWVAKRGRQSSGVKAKAKANTMDALAGALGAGFGAVGKLAGKFALAVKVNALDTASLAARGVNAAAAAGKQATVAAGAVASKTASAAGAAASKTARFVTPTSPGTTPKGRHGRVIIGDGAATPLLNVPSEQGMEGAPSWGSAPAAPPQPPAPPPAAPWPPPRHRAGPAARKGAALPRSPNASPVGAAPPLTGGLNRALSSDTSESSVDWWGIEAVQATSSTALCSISASCQALDSSDSESELAGLSRAERRRRRQEGIARVALCSASDGEEEGAGGNQGARAGCRRGAVAEAVEGDTMANGDDEDEDDEEELLWEYKEPRLNDADNAHTFTTVMLNCLRNACEGHHTKLQRLLQSQTHAASQSYDLVVEGVELLNVLQDHIQAVLVAEVPDPALPDLMVALFAFLREIIMGPCVQNQLVLSMTNFLVSCNRIFGYIEHVVPCSTAHAILRCKIKIGLLSVLTSLLEGVTCQNGVLKGVSSCDTPYRCLEILDFVAMERQIQKLAFMLGLEEGKEPIFDLDDDDENDKVSKYLREELLAFCAFILKLNYTAPQRKPALPFIQQLYLREQRPDVYLGEDLSQEQKRYSRKFQAFLSTRLGYVEVTWNDGVEPHLFELEDECCEKASTAVWATTTLQSLQDNVSPDSRAFPAVKAAELVTALQEVVEDIELDSYLHSMTALRPFYIITKFRAYTFQTTFYLAVAALIVQTLLDERWDYNDSIADRKHRWGAMLLSVLIALQVTACCFMALAFWFTDLRKHLSKRKEALDRELLRETQLKAAQDVNEEEDVSKPLGISAPPKLEDRGWAGRLRASGKQLNAIVGLVFYWKFWYVCILVASSFFAFFVSPFFMVIHFTIYFVDFDSGKTLVEAMTRSGVQIINTFVLGIISIYTFAVVTFLAFRQPLLGDQDQPPPCATFYQCMGTHMLAGLTGDISVLFAADMISTVPERVDENNVVQARTFFILIFFMLWSFVLSNIFVGLIASSFEAIRDDQNTIAVDSASTCLVCSNTMYTFDEYTQGGFGGHVAIQHNPLHYVYFLHRLSKRDAEDYTGVESNVQSVFQNATTATDKGGWLPVGKSLLLANAMKEKEGATSSATTEGSSAGMAPEK